MASYDRTGRPSRSLRLLEAALLAFVLLGTAALVDLGRTGPDPVLGATAAAPCAPVLQVLVPGNAEGTSTRPVWAGATLQRFRDAVRSAGSAEGLAVETRVLNFRSRSTSVFPVRSRASSSLHYRGRTHSRLWKLMDRYDVDLYLSGEVHDTQLVERDGIVQVSHGGAFQFGLTTALVLDFYGGNLLLSLRDYDLRFIEQMPLDAQHGWSRAEMITAEEILASLQREFSLSPAEEPRGSAPAELFAVNGGPATVGVIASVTRPFCGDCDRVRLTADGQIRNCLFATEESNLRDALRAGATDAELAERWRKAVWAKRAGHGIDDPSFLQPARPMSAIGG